MSKQSDIADDPTCALEMEKIEFSKALEREKLDAARKLAAYNQNFSQFRSLNDHLHKLPAFSTTLIGGLWFVAGLKDTLIPEIRFVLMFIAGWFGLMAILVMLRLRDVMQSYLERIREFDPDSFARGRPEDPMLSTLLQNYSMVGTFAAMGLITVVLSWVAAFTVFWPKAWVCAWWGVGATIVTVLLLFYVLIVRKSEKL